VSTAPDWAVDTVEDGDGAAPWSAEPEQATAAKLNTTRPRGKHQRFIAWAFGARRRPPLSTNRSNREVGVTAQPAFSGEARGDPSLIDPTEQPGSPDEQDDDSGAVPFP